MRFLTAAVVSALAAVSTAYTQPNYSKPPSGNPIMTPGLNAQVPEGQPYSITWTPTTPGTISLVLLRGPSNNVQPIETIADSIPNSGSYKWTPSTSLTPDTTHYGLLLVVEHTGQYQYSTQFGISAAKVSTGAAPVPSPNTSISTSSDSTSSDSTSSESTSSESTSSESTSSTSSTSTSTKSHPTVVQTEKTATATSTSSSSTETTQATAKTTTKTTSKTTTTTSKPAPAPAATITTKTTKPAPVTTSSSTTTTLTTVASAVATKATSTPAMSIPSGFTPSPSATFGAAGHNTVNLGVVAAGLAAAVIAL